MVRLRQAPKSSEITLHFLAIECDSKYIITQNFDLSTFRKKIRKQEDDETTAKSLFGGIYASCLLVL